ncbi:hypothetical protein AHAS_Ahas10G0069100 [Arachis hypogaea]
MSKIMAYMAGQSGGYGMLQFTKRDLYNYVHGQRLARINNGDATAMISYLEGKANANMMTVDVTPELPIIKWGAFSGPMVK